jgi:hypothetical protein
MTIIPYNYARTITKSDTVDIPSVNNELMTAIYVGGAGNIVAVYKDGSTQTFTGLLAGAIYPITCVRVNSTNTTATALLALYQI